MANLLVSILLALGVFFLLNKHGNLQNEDVNVMVGGSLLFSAIGNLATGIIAVFTVGLTGIFLASIIMTLINGLLAYYFLSKAGII